jgi:hypothetical protein
MSFFLTNYACFKPFASVSFLILVVPIIANGKGDPQPSATAGISQTEIFISPFASSIGAKASICLEVGGFPNTSTEMFALLEEAQASAQDTSLSKMMERQDDFEILFDGTNLDKWTGNTTDYIVEDGVLVIYPDRGGKGDLFTKKEFSDFIFQFEFQLTPGANNGLGIRAPLEGSAAFDGIELQIIDNTAEKYKNIEDYQRHGSVYGVIPAKTGYLKPVGEWNYQEVVVKGPHIKVILNGTVILDGNVEEASKNGTLDGKEHPGLKRKSGHIGFLGHGDVVKFRNMRVKDLGNK